MEKDKTMIIVTKDVNLQEPLTDIFPNARVLVSRDIDELIEWYFLPNF